MTIRLHRPSKRNALTLNMYSGIAHILDAAASDPGIRAVLLTGSPNCFTAGNDLIEARIEGLDSPHGRFMDSLSGFPKPVIAAPSGIAVGVGVTLLFHCDLVYCGANTTFRLPFVPLAVVPEFGSTVLLPRIAGYHRACELLLTGEPFNATTAKEFGIVNDVLPNDQVEEFALARATFIAAQPPSSVRATKMLLKRTLSARTQEAIREEMKHLLELQDGDEAREAVVAFQAKRRADTSARR
jgi:enoyl-CoA hydratase/carnithine racemase